MKILLAVDGSHFSLAAADAVALRPWPPGTIVRVVHVNESAGEPTEVNPARMQPPFPPPPDAIEKALGRLEGHQLKVEAKILPGRPKSAILDEARDWGADLIVVGSHGMSGIERFVLGSVSQAVASHAHCSVEIVRTMRQPQPRV
ncbi:MAG: universal stress protein [Acidobacteria bacterium]|nr:universal stress protein [Acidobacteriota bacterium]